MAKDALATYGAMAARPAWRAVDPRTASATPAAPGTTSTRRHASWQNGAIVGRVHMHRLGHGMVDLGAFKIAPDARVVQVPEAVAAAPSGSRAGSNPAA
jgi:hypothetical protein